MSTGTALKRSTVLNDSVLERAQSGRARTDTKDRSKAQIAANPFYVAMTEAGHTPEARKAVVAKLLTSTGDKVQDRANVQLYEDFREWLAEQSTELAQQIIELTNVNTMAQLQSVIKDMNTDLLNFENRMEPLMKIIDAIYQLRSQGGPDTITDAFAEIERDNEHKAQLQKDIADIEQKRGYVEKEIERLNQESIAEGSKRTLFGFGTVPAASREKITQNEAEIARKREEISKLTERSKEIASQTTESSLGELAPYKEQLANLLNMTSDESKQQLIDLRDSAIKFIETSDERTGALRGQFTEMREQIGRVEDNNSGMTRTYAILVEAMAEADKNNLAIRENVTKAPESESMIDRTVREEKLSNLDDHVMVLKRSQADTVSTHAELAQQRMRVQTMKSSADDQIETARKLNSQGVSGVADRIAMSLTAISGAALNESAAVASLTLDRMRRTTNTITESEVVKAAMNLDKINSGLMGFVTEMGNLHEVTKHATDIAHASMQEMNDNLAKLQEQTEEVSRAIKERAAVGSQANAERDGVGQKTQTQTPASPFANV